MKTTEVQNSVAFVGSTQTQKTTKSFSLLKHIMLTFLMLAWGSGVWGQETTVLYERGYETAWSDAHIAEWEKNGDNTACSINNGLKFAKTSVARSEYTYTHSLSTVADASETLEVLWGSGTANGSGTAGNYILFGDVKLFWCGQERYLDITIGGVTNRLISSGSTSLRGTDFNVSITINKRTKVVTYSISNSSYNSGNTITGSGVSLTGDVSSVVFGWSRGGQQNVSDQTVKKIQVTEQIQSLPTAAYTILYKCGDTEIQDRSNGEGVIGEVVPVSHDVIWFNDKKYFYVSDDAETNPIASDGSTVVTVTYREAEKYSYTVTTSYGGESLPYSTSGSVWEDEPSVTISYPRYQARGSLLLERAPVGNNLETQINVTNDNYITDLTYNATSVDNLYLLSEAENLGTGLPTNGTSFTGRVSNRQIIYGASGKLCSLPAGKYKFSLGMIGGDNSTHKVNYVVSAGTAEIINATCNGNTLMVATSAEFILSEETDITFTCSDPSSSRGIDLIYIVKTGDFVSFAQQFDLDKAAHAALPKISALDADGQTAYHNAVDAITAPADQASYDAAVAELENAYIIGVKAQTTPGADMTALVQNADCSAIAGWSITPEPTSGAKFQLNTWSTEADGTGMTTPFIEYWVDKQNGNLSNATISHEQITGLHAGYYRVGGLVRIYSETGNTTLSGAVLNVNGESIDMCVVGTPVKFNTLQGVYGNFSKVVHVDEDGNIDFNIAVNGANFNWIALKNFTLTYVGEELPKHTWDFTNWSEATKDNLEADENWTHDEKGDGTNVQSGCYWQVTTQAGTLTANDVAIAELEGLNFTNNLNRVLAIATNYPSTSLGTYHGGSYLWLGGKISKDEGIYYFTIPNVKQGTKIRMGVESHNTSDARGVDLYVNGNKISGPAAYPTTYQELEWTVPTDARKKVLDVVVRNSNGCHIYWIDAEIGEQPFYDFALDLTNNSDLLTSDEKAAQGNAFNFGITADETTTSRVAVGASNTVATVTGNYYNDHGSQNVVVVTKVPGPVAIIMGTCGYGETRIKVTPEGGEPQILATHDRTGSGSDCWKGNHDNVIVGNYMGEATTLTIENAGSPHYTPYIAVRQITDPTSTPVITSTGEKAKFVTITCSTPNATIYYTTDGSEPTASSSKYNNAFTVLATTTIKAKAFAPGLLPSEVAQASVTGQTAALTSNTYYNAVVSNVDELLTALNAAPGSSRYRIFVKNGTYDLKGASLTTVKGNVSLIGESQKGVLIKNTPDKEGIGITATLLIQGEDNYLQDLQLMCDVDYDQGAGAGRGVAMQDKGTRTIAKNVSLLSNQDTYYSSGGNNQQGYFETSYITGTVDYICGGGDIWFERTTLYNNARANGDVITAPATNALTQWGYVFNECTVDGDAGQSGKYNLGRPWQGSPAATWLNTTWKIPSSSAGYTSMGAGLKLRFHEYPLVSGHSLRNCNGSGESDALALDAAGAARYTLANVFPSWTPATHATQIAAPQIEGNAEGTKIIWTAVGGSAHAIAICCNGSVIDFVAPTAAEYILPQSKKATDKWSIRVANAMGGLGEPSDEIEVQAAAEFNDAAMDLTNHVLLGTETITGVSPKYLHLETDGTVRVVATEGESNAKVTTATYKDDACACGYTGFTMVVNVPGPLKIGVGQCGNGGKVHVVATPIAPSSSKLRVAPIITDSDNDIDIDLTGAEYIPGSENISYGYYNGTGAATLTITTVDDASINYLSLEKIADEPILLDITTDLKSSYATILNRPLLLKIEATGIEPDYQWYECDDAQKSNPRKIEGETTPDFKYTPTTNTTRYFYCEVTDGTATDLSTVAAVSVVEDNGVLVGNWRRYLLQDYQNATVSDWVNRSNSVLSIETNNGKYNHQTPSGSGDRGAYFDLDPYTSLSHLDWDEWKLEWDAQLTQGNTNDRSHSAFAITNGIPGANTAVFNNCYMYLGADMITASGDRTRWYLLPNGYINDKPDDAQKIRLTNGNVNFNLDPSKWYHFKVTYNSNNEVHVVISSGATVVAEAKYTHTLPIKGVQTIFSTVGRGSGVANVDNIDFSVFDTAPAFVTDLSDQKDVYATRRDTLMVETEGALSLQWYRCDDADGNGAVAIDGATSEQYFYTPTTDDIGNLYFFAEATNTLGTSRSVITTVHVHEVPPEITTIALGDFNFGNKKYKVNITGVGTIMVKVDDADDFVEYNPTNTFALNSVTAKAVGSAGGESMPVTIFAPMQNDPNKPFAAWVYQPDYLNTSSKTDMEHEVQASPILQNVQTYYNVINVPLSKDDNYDQGNNTLDQANLVIMSDMVEGNSTLTKSLKGLYGIVPLINMKAYSYSAGRWDWGTPGEGDTAPITINPVNPWLQIFEGVAVADNSNTPSATDFGLPGIDMFNKQHTEWDDSYKHLLWVTSPTSDAASFTKYATAIATDNIMMHGKDGVVSEAYSEDAGKINAAEYSTAPYILFSLNADNGLAVSDDASKVLGNIANLILHGQPFGTVSSIAPTITDNGDGSAHIETDIYKGSIYYKVVSASDAAPDFDAETWSQPDAEGNTAKLVAGDWKVYAVVKYPTSLTNKPAGVTIPAGVSDKAVNDLVGTDDRIITFVGGTSDILDGDEVNHKYTVPSKFSIFSEGTKVAIDSDYKIPMNVYMVKAEPGKEDEPVRPYYRFAGWTANQDVTALVRNERPDDFDPLNPPAEIPYPGSPNNPKPAGTLLGTTTFVRMPANDLTFTSQFYKNKVSLANASASTLVTWDFTTDGVLYDRRGTVGNYTEGPEYTQSHFGIDVWPSEPMNVENNAFYYNRLAHVLDLDYPDELNQLDFSYRYIDVPLFMDSRNVSNNNGHIYNVSFDNTASSSYAKTNDHMIFGIPAVYGMQIRLIGNNSDGKITTFDRANSQTTIGGEKVNAAEHKLLSNIENRNDSKGNPVLSMTYLGKDDYLYVDLNEGQNGGEVYMKGISVTYPARVRLTPQVKVGDESTPAAGKIYYKPLGEEVEMTDAAAFSTNVADTLTAKAEYGYKFVGWYDNGGVQIETGVTNGEVDSEDNLLTSTLVITPSASGNITAKFEAISTVKLAVTTYRNTPEEVKTPNEQVGEMTISDEYGDYAKFELTTTQLNKTITFEPQYNSTTKKYEIDVTPGTVVTIHGTQIPGNRFNKWVTWDGAVATQVSTHNPYTVTVSASTTLYAQFDDATDGFNIDYAVNGEWGSVPMQQGVLDFAVPRYYSFYQEGHTIVGWTNQSATKYYIYNGETDSQSTALTGANLTPSLTPTDAYQLQDDQTLTPVFVENHPYARLEGRREPVTITWDLTRDARAQVMTVPGNSTGRYTTRATVLARDGKYYTCDVPLHYITGQRGRINNTTSPQWCTVGFGTVFAVPVCKGATVQMEVRSPISDTDGGTRFNGAVPLLSKVKYAGGSGFVAYDPDNKTAIESYLYTYTYNGNAETMDIEIGDDYSYYRTISVTLPSVGVKREVELMASDLTDWTKSVGEGGYGYSAGKLTTHNTDEQLTFKFDSNVTANPNTTLSAASQYVAGEKGYIQATSAGRSFSISGMSNLTRICYRQGARIANGWRVDATYKEIVHNDETGLDEEVERTITLVADRKCTTPERVEINDIYLKNPTITFTNISYLEKQQGVGSAYDAYLFNLELYGILETTNAQAILDVYDQTDQNDGGIISGGKTSIAPYTMCLPTPEEQLKFQTAGVRPVPGLEHYASYNRTLQFDHGSEVKLTANPELGFEFEKWTDEKGNVLSTQNPYVFNIYDDVKVYANYKRIGHLFYTFGTQNLEGALPAEQETAGGQFTVRTNHSIAKPGDNTLVYWVNPQDPTAEKAALGVTQAQYVPGKTYTYGPTDDHFTDYDVYLNPVFMPNSFSLLDIEDEKGVTVTWPFGYQGEAPELNIEQRAGFVVGQAFKGSEFIDLRMDIDARKQPNGKYGKVNNVGRTDNMAQVNANTVFTLPMTKGMKIELVADRSTGNTLVGGSKPTATGNTTTFRPTKTGQGDANIGGNEVGSVVVYMNDNCNMSYIRATYYPRCKQPEITLSSVNTVGASIDVASPTSGATVYYTLDGSEPTAGSTKLTGNTISNITFTDNQPVTVKAIAISDSRPDSKVTTYIVSPYDVNKKTAVYLYNSADKAYDMDKDVVYSEMVKELTPDYNVVAYDIKNGVPASEHIASSTKENVKAYVSSDADKSKATVVSIVGSKPVVTIQNVIPAGSFTWNAAGNVFDVVSGVDVPGRQDNLAIFDKVLISHDNKVCINNTTGTTLSDLNYNAAFLLTNATKAVVDGTYTAGDWLTETTTAPQVRNPQFSGNYVPAPELATLAGGEVDYPVNVWMNTITVGATVGVGTGYIDYVQPSTSGSMEAKVKLYSDEDKKNLIREYVIHLIVQTNTDELIYSSAKMNDEGTEWNNGIWSVSRMPDGVTGNDGECFKFNGSEDNEITITGPANYGIKSVTLRGYDYTGAYAGAGAASGFTATHTGGSEFAEQTTTLKKYQANEAVTKGELVLNYPLGASNTTSFKLTDGNQFVGTIIVEYYQRKPDAVTLKASSIHDNEHVLHNGTFKLTFDSQMAEVNESAGVTITNTADEEIAKLTATGNESALTFRYWNLLPGDYFLNVPYAALHDIYGTAFTGKTEETSMTVEGSAYKIPFTVNPTVFEHKVFDFIVDDTDNGIHWDGTHIDALNKLGDVNDGMRHVIYFPNRKNDQNRYFIGPNGTKFTDANSLTKLSANNLSFIGESRKYVVIANNPKTEGSSSTPTLQFERTMHNYMQDLTIRDEYPYVASNFAGRATTLYDRGYYTVLKNVSMESFQDTYYTGGMYGYNEDCRFSGVVDFIYGHGDYWFQNCDIIVRNRNGNNITAANTTDTEKWGYVFMDCTINKEEGATLVADGTFTLGRPWNGSPAVSWINTTMHVKPTNAGWQQMDSGFGKVLRMHEYNSKNPDGSLISLAGRSVAGMSPAEGSYSAVMSDEQAAEYTLHNVLGGDEGYDPTEYTRQIGRLKDVYFDGHTLQWEQNDSVLCYNVYYLGDGDEADSDNAILIANITSHNYNIMNETVFRSSDSFIQWYANTHGGKEFESGWFAVRAANQRGGLNEISNFVEYHEARTYNTIVSTAGKAEGDDSGNVWSTIYLDFPAVIPYGMKAYALSSVTAYGDGDVTETTLVIEHVSTNAETTDTQDVILADQGYLLYGPAGEANFVETGRHDTKPSHFSGTIGRLKPGCETDSPNFEDYEDIPIGDVHAYTLATHTKTGIDYGLGFYQYSGSTLGHHKAYLDTDVANRLLGIETTPQSLSKALRIMVIEGTTTRIIGVRNGNTKIEAEGEVFNLAGQRIRPSQMVRGQIYIVGGKKIRF